MSWYDYKHQHIFVGEYKNGNISSWKDIMEGEPFDAPLKPFGSSGQIALDPKGRFLAYTCKKESDTGAAMSTNSGIYLYEFETGQTLLLTEKNKGYDTYPSFSPDGQWIAWLSMQTPGFEADKNRLMVADISGSGAGPSILSKAIGSVFELTKDFDLGADAFKWDPKQGSKKIFFNAGVEGTHNLHQVEWSNPTTIKLTAITEDRADYQEFSVAYQRDVLRMIASRMAIDAPTEIYEIQPKEGKATPITQETANALNGIKMGKVESRMVTTFDRKKMLTWVIYPPDFDPTKKYPTLLYCQGGPQSTVSQFFSYRWNFQLMAAQGYIIVAPNRRGLPSFGTEWNERISGDWGGAAMKDLLAAIDDVSKESYVAKDKLGAVGASFGGYSVYWLAGNHDGRFKAFISHCGVFNLESMYGTTEEMFFVHHDLGGAYWDVPPPISYLMHSPHKYVHKWDTPMLVIHNERDYRVPLGQGMEAFTAAQLRGIPSRFLYFEDEGHWVNKVQNSIVWNRVFFDWLDTFLK
jgi:dipeptidyl aminopeptidase/acylaminoacyl peptidase